MELVIFLAVLVLAVVDEDDPTAASPLLTLRVSLP